MKPNIPNARPRSSPRNSCWISPEFCGVSSPALAPWTSRATTIQRGAGREPDGGAGDHEADQPDEHHPAPAVGVAEPAAGDQRHPERQRVARHHPLHGGGRGVEPGPDRGDRDVDDGDVEQRHEPDQQRHRQDAPAPRVGLRTPPPGRGRRPVSSCWPSRPASHPTRRPIVDSWPSTSLVETVIARPVTEVAAYAGDPSRAPEWYANIREVAWQTEPPVAVGSRMDFVARFLGRRLAYTYEVVELVPDERLVMRTADGPFPMETTYTWEPAGDGATRMTLRNRGTPSGFAGVAASVLERRDAARHHQGPGAAPDVARGLGFLRERRPPAPPLRQGPRPLRDPRRPPADGRQRPDLRLRLRPRRPDPGQGRDPDPDVAVVVRPAGRPGAPPRGLHRRPRAVRRPRGRLRAARHVSRSSASPAATSPAPGCSTTAPPARSAGSRCRRASRTAAGCPSRSSRRPPRPTLGDHDENVSYDAVVETVGADVAAELRELTLAVYERAEARSPASAASSWPTPSSSSAGAPTATMVLADEVLTPDSSRFWPAEEWQPGRPQPSYDKQFVRNWLLSAGVRLGPALRRGAARRCRTRSSSAPGSATSRPTSGSPGSGSDQRGLRRVGGARPPEGDRLRLPRRPRATGRSGSPRCCR